MTDPAVPTLGKGATPAEIAAHVETLLGLMSLEEKVYMMSGHGVRAALKASRDRWGGDPYQTGGGCERLGVKAYFFTDGPRGVVRGRSTCFPVTMARGATFDPELERRVGEVFGIEARAQDCNFTGAVCINLLRHPAWGRAQETYGEDPHLLGEMGAAFSEGIQAHNVAASVKHFALNSIENARFKVDVTCDDRTLREVYLPHFKRVIDSGCATVMSAYNSVNGEFCGQNKVLLTDILREEWGFDGVVHTDWFRGVHDIKAVAAGLDVENPEPVVLGDNLVAAVRAGTVDEALVDRACRRILSVHYRFESAEDPLAAYPMDLVACDAHRAVALEAARKSAVLLENDGLLPLDRRALKKVAVLGRLAKLGNTGDRGSSFVQPPYIITPLQGITAALPEAEVVHADEEDLAAVRAACDGAEAVVCVVGNTFEDEGEFISQNFSFRNDDEADQPPAQTKRGGDRDHLRLRAEQETMIKAARAANPNVVVVIVAGSAVIVEAWKDQARAILQTFYAGMEGGRVLAELLLGEVSPSGKLPFTVPADEAQLPFFDKEATAITYGPLHGYTLFDSRGAEAPYPFGFGLSYARFGYRAARARVQGQAIAAQVAVRNDGAVAAEEVVQLYVGFPGRDAERPVKLLKGFRRVALAPGETTVIDFSVPLDALRWWNPATRAWQLETGTHVVLMGGSSRAADLSRVEVEL